MAPLPPYLVNAYRFRASDEDPTVLATQLHRWIGSSLGEEYLRYQLNRHRGPIHGHIPTIRTTPSLFSSAVGSILHSLANSKDLPAAVAKVYGRLEPLQLKEILNDPRTCYQILRAFSRHPDFTMITPKGIRTLMDIDEAVTRNERYIRTLTDIDQKNKYLVDLKDLYRTLPVDTHIENSIVFTRRDPPKGGFEFLNAKRKRKLQIASNESNFRVSFSATTYGALLGLDWCNVIVAGGVALASLLQVSNRSIGLEINEPGISLYIHGLQPDAANRKLHDIHDTWASNIPPNAQKLVVKSAKAIDLITNCPERSIRINLKLYTSAIDVLLDSDLDACAIGFDGSRVLMLPRCARTIETGYSVFTMDLVWGCPREGRRASSMYKLFAYAERGFGVRILPSYARLLEDDTFEKLPLEELHLNDARSDAGDMDEEETQQVIHKNIQMPRRISSSEPGLKELKRVARLAECYVRDLYLEQQNREAARTLPADPDLAHEERITLMDIMEPDGALPNRGYGLSGGQGFDVLMRYCEVWRLYARGLAEFDMYAIPRAPLYDHPVIDDDLPRYGWHDNLDIQEFAANINEYNVQVWGDTKTAICSKLGIPRNDSGFMDYSTRRVRRMVYGYDLASVQEKQITTPVVIPAILEDYLLAHLPAQYNLPSHFVGRDATKPLIPLHDPTQHVLGRITTIPSLYDTGDEEGNLRYWVITNQSMWANQHEVMDEFAELMWCIFKWFTSACNINPPAVDFDQPECIWSLSRYLRQRIIMPEIPGDPMGSLRQGLLFKPWVLKRPKSRDDTAILDENRRQAEGAMASMSTPGFPLPNEYDWQEGDEGDWIGHDVPAWTDVLKRKREEAAPDPRKLLRT